ncbi:penicillin-binding protein [Prochlorothrix hollandica PCC 9006 = CALU 1027]|uniref:Penicillin-binding protein n=1 Tax=Prochlorothrix hollandica PCC 9006 = CALU 1027 TaxID=317619 RepID=A0A0M2PSZ4_PROHO|nr:penicillin-binding protein [Prochlorothrix hollandica PCC 9006 = CALU 1027]
MFTPTAPPSTPPRTIGRSLQSVFVMAAVSALMLGGLGSRLAYLQLIEGDRNRQLAEENRVRLVSKPPERGQIFDRNGKLLVGSNPSYSLFLWPIALEEAEWPIALQRLSHILRVPVTEIQTNLEKEGYNSPYRVRVARGLTIQQVVALEEARTELKGVEIDAETMRYYPNGDLAAHVLGYTGEITDSELESLEDRGYRMGDVLGKLGVEAALEDQLRGEWGGQQVEVDAMGEVIRILGEKPPIPGDDVILTLNSDLQKKAEQVLGNTKGAIVAMDPRNGEVLAMASRPAYDPNIFSSRISDEQWQQLQAKEHPFLNRALRSFAPASTYKIITTVAGLESGKFSPGTVLPTFPYLEVGGIQFWDWNRAGFGPLSFQGAMTWSSDTFFYQIGRSVGGEVLAEWSRKFGMGQLTGIELAEEESPGVVPDNAWKEEMLDEIWYIGDSINMSIGQGYMQATPLQVAMMFAVPANGGDLVQPHLQLDLQNRREWTKSINLKPSTIQVLREGLRDVVQVGTGAALRTNSIPPVAGKTGTAEDQPRKSHTWFGGYAPADNPEIVVVAFTENSGGGGGSLAAPMVRSILEAYFQGQKTPAPKP